MARVPPPMMDDPEDVSWALQAAESQLLSGDLREALKWVRRAAEAASEASNDMRALDLAKAAAELANDVPPAPDSIRPRPPPLPTARSAPPASTPPQAPSAPPRPSPSTPPRPAAKPAGRTTQPRMQAPVKAKVAPKPIAKVPLVKAKEDTKSTKPPPPPTADEIDAWPTEQLGSEDLPVFGDQPTRMAQAYVPPVEMPKVPTAQAVRVIVYRTADGVHIAPAGTTVSAITMDAMLVALEPGADLAALLFEDKKT